MDPSQARGGIKTAHKEQDRLLDPNFKFLFHRSIVQHSMAAGCFQFARRARDQPTDPFKLNPEINPETQELKSIVADLWQEIGIESDFESTALRLDYRSQCLEVSDFLYLFLLPKILPFEGLTSWIGNDGNRHPYADIPVDGNLDTEWLAFLELSRCILQPHDIVELIETNAWSDDYPADKSMYMQTRGMFDGGEQSTGSWGFNSYSTQMVEDLRESLGFLLRRVEDPFWWDNIRIRCGSTFLPESWSKYREDWENLRKWRGGALELQKLGGRRFHYSNALGVHWSNVSN